MGLDAFSSFSSRPSPSEFLHLHQDQEQNLASHSLGSRRSITSSLAFSPARNSVKFADEMENNSEVRGRAGVTPRRHLNRTTMFITGDGAGCSSDEEEDHHRGRGLPPLKLKTRTHPPPSEGAKFQGESRPWYLDLTTSRYLCVIDNTLAERHR